MYFNGEDVTIRVLLHLTTPVSVTRQSPPGSGPGPGAA
jgi:hypothetical protein